MQRSEKLIIFKNFFFSKRLIFLSLGVKKIKFSLYRLQDQFTFCDQLLKSFCPRCVCCFPAVLFVGLSMSCIQIKLYDGNTRSGFRYWTLVRHRTWSRGNFIKPVLSFNLRQSIVAWSLLQVWDIGSFTMLIQRSSSRLDSKCRYFHD